MVRTEKKILTYIQNGILIVVNIVKIGLQLGPTQIRQYNY